MTTYQKFNHPITKSDVLPHNRFVINSDEGLLYIEGTLTSDKKWLVEKTSSANNPTRKLGINQLIKFVNGYIEDGYNLYLGFDKELDSYLSEKMKGHRTSAPSKKSCPVKVDFRKML